MKKTNIIVMTLVLTLSLLMFIGYGYAENELTVGMELQYPPFETTDESGEPMGISVDLAYALGEYLGRDVVIQNTAWAGLIPAIQSKKVDVIISSMSVRPDRAESVAFSKPYAHSTLAILANAESGIKSIEDINQKGMKVAVKLGTTGFLYANESLPNAEIITVDKADTAMLEVSQGKSDAFLYDQMSIFNAQAKYPETTIAILEPFQGEAEYWAMAVKLDNLELLEEINMFIDEYEADGGFEKLSVKYLSDMKATFDDLGLDFFFQPSQEELTTGE